MASERVFKILEFRQAPFTRAELDAMSERDAWKWLYKHFPPRSRKSAPTAPGVVFSGMPESMRPELREYAGYCGFRVMASMSAGVRYLVVGEAPGPAKLAYAREHTVPIIPVTDFVDQAERLFAQVSPHPKE